MPGKVVDWKSGIGRDKRGYAFVFVVGDQGFVRAGLRVPMDEQAAGRHIEDPIFGNSGAGIKGGFGCEIKLKGGIGDLYHEIQIDRLWNSLAKRGELRLEHDNVRNRFIRGIIFGSNVDRSSRIDKPCSENLNQPASQQRSRINVRAALWPLNQFPRQPIPDAAGRTCLAIPACRTRRASTGGAAGVGRPVALDVVLRVTGMGSRSSLY